ncbi:bidirectional hydrogenase complex protein HoxU [bacterium]|nr:bidirectional hydrogenase complex protein HoxU [bacterium]MBU1984529.1 bidirectional hydrogenase complex protein HoxU [bacterium]
MIGQPFQIITLTMDGKPVGARYGETLLEVARENNIFIPTLCYFEGLSTLGACRLCLVEVKGWYKLAPACVTMVHEGMEVMTRSERLDRYRRLILELLYSERNHVCSVCIANGYCDLQSLAEKLGIDHVRIPYRYPKFLVDATHDRFVSDNNRCVLCQRCVRACGEIEGAHTLDIMRRGVFARVVSDLDQPWGDSTTCTRCGKCAQVCPTAAIMEKGRSFAEKLERRDLLPYLTTMREEERK